MSNQKILILGVTGMLGHALFVTLSRRDNLAVRATARDRGELLSRLDPELLGHIYDHVDISNFDSVLGIMSEIKPDTVINCIGIIKQLPIAQDPLVSISINALFPHQLANACKNTGARLIHISTDCVFSGKKGNYTEQDPSDAEDLYGRTKYLGEVSYPHCITLRTSIIGHELKGGYGLIDWFLRQQGRVRGFTNAIYTGFPTVEMARIISDHVIPHPRLSGLYHVSSEPISKHDLLALTAGVYGKNIEIEPFADYRCDRSLDSTRFREATGYRPPSWPELIAAMHGDYERTTYYARP